MKINSLNSQGFGRVYATQDTLKKYVYTQENLNNKKFMKKLNRAIMENSKSRYFDVLFYDDGSAKAVSKKGQTSFICDSYFKNSSPIVALYKAIRYANNMENAVEKVNLVNINSF